MEIRNLGELPNSFKLLNKLQTHKLMQDVIDTETVKEDEFW